MEARMTNEIIEQENPDEITLDKRRVMKVVKVTTEAASKKVKNLEAPEAIIGFAEALGRIIAAQQLDVLGHQELIKVACNHVIDTVKAAYAAQGLFTGDFEA